MKNLKNLVKTCIVCTLLWFAVPSPAFGQYETTYEEQYGQPPSESDPKERKSEDDNDGIPWWGWAIIGWIIFGWLVGDDDDDSDRSSSSSSSSNGGEYVIDPSR